MRRKIVAGNWKMNKLAGEAGALAAAVREKLAECRHVELVLCPPFTALRATREALSGSPVRLGAQNMHWEKSGAYTGEVSPDMLRDAGCDYVILGHSERRALFGETSEMVNRKAKAAIAAGLCPIVCVGESLQEREAGRMQAVVSDQVQKSLADLKDRLAGVVIAYEPVWAIGTGKTASPEQAEEVHALIRRLVAQMATPSSAEAVRILYGGSVKPANAKSIFGQPDIDGGLIGGASLEAQSFVEIVTAAV